MSGGSIGLVVRLVLAAVMQAHIASASGPATRSALATTRPATMASAAPTTRATTGPSTGPAPQATMAVTLRLGRYDMPIGFAARDAMSRQVGARRVGADVVDWPQFTLDGLPLFALGGEQRGLIALRSGAESLPLFRQTNDSVIQPGDHWFRCIAGQGGKRWIYTTDATARCGRDEVELWTFPVQITGDGAAAVGDVVLRYRGQTIYANAGPVHSLTLLLPANETGGHYELVVGGRKAVSFDVGLAASPLGRPTDAVIPVSLDIGGREGAVHVRSIDEPDAHANSLAWQIDTMRLGRVIAGAHGPSRRMEGPGDYLGIEVNGSPISTYTVASPGRDFEKSAARMAGAGYDMAVRDTAEGDDAGDAEWLDRLLQHGMRGSLSLSFLSGGDLSLFSSTIAQWHGPRFRDAQLVVQRCDGYPNFVAAMAGASDRDSAGSYEPGVISAPPDTARPWGQAVGNLGVPAPQLVLSPKLTPRFDYEGQGTMRQFADSLGRFDATWDQYTYFGDAVRGVDRRLQFTTRCFGAIGGGWPDVLPGRSMFEGLDVLQVCSAQGDAARQPLAAVGMIDRLRSVWPDKPAWLLMDGSLTGASKANIERAYGLALTRGLQGIGEQSSSEDPNIVAMHQLVHRLGGALAYQRPDVPVGVLYVHAQAAARAGGESHDAKALEAMLICHAAGWPARIVTPFELTRGLPANMKALLLVGLGDIDNSWHWYEGLEGPLQKFAAAGGKILVDDESALPKMDTLPTVATGMHVAARAGANGDRGNVALLRKAMTDVPAAAVTCDDPTVWVIPTRVGRMRYFTVVPMGGRAATRPALHWNATGALYDVRQGRAAKAGEAIDFGGGGFSYYALAPAEVTAPTLRILPGSGAFYEALATVGQCGEGVPIQVDVRWRPLASAVPSTRPTTTRPGDVEKSSVAPNPTTAPAEVVTVYGSSDRPIRLPIAAAFPGTYDVTATELLSGRTSSMSVTVDAAGSRSPAAMAASQPADTTVERFITRDVPLVVALTPAQVADSHTMGLAHRLAAALAAKGRRTSVRTILPGEVVVGLQPVLAVQRRPQWRTIDADLILMGSPRDNVLIMDEARGMILPAGAYAQPAVPTTVVTHSPFVGEFDVLNLIASDSAGLGKLVEDMLQ